MRSGCFNCGSDQHKVKDCPNSEVSDESDTTECQTAQQESRGRSFGSGAARQGQSWPTEPQLQQGQQRGPLHGPPQRQQGPQHGPPQQQDPRQDQRHLDRETQLRRNHSKWKYCSPNPRDIRPFPVTFHHSKFFPKVHQFKSFTRVRRDSNRLLQPQLAAPAPTTSLQLSRRVSWGEFPVSPQPTNPPPSADGSGARGTSH
jgi:hypothetical protein